MASSNLLKIKIPCKYTLISVKISHGPPDKIYRAGQKRCVNSRGCPGYVNDWS